MTRTEKHVLGGMTLESLQPEDVDETSRLLASMDPWRTLDYKRETLAFYLLRADPALKRYSITIAGDLSGVLSVRYPWLFGPFIELIALFGDCRGTGYGRRLIDWVARSFPPSANLWATVSSFNLDAREFYRRSGFKEATVLQDLIKPGLHEILLRKQI